MTPERKPSVFAQRMRTMRECQDTSVSNSTSGDEERVNVAGVEMSSVRSDNEALLRNMSQNEIEKKQRELYRVLSPESLAFLKNRAARGKAKIGIPPQSFNKSTSQKSPNVEIKNQIVNHHSSSDNNLQRDDDETYGIERQKMKWMEDVPTSVKPLPDTLFNARFDFEGNLLPYIVENESTSSKGLYHHGNEPERPGYTLDELFQLSRSSFPRQRVVALDTIAAILENEFILSSHLETQLLPELLNSGIFLILRFALDERLKSVYLAALRAMSALLWKTVDMHYLTDSVGIFGDMRLPSFEVNNSTLDSANQKELRDSELLALDVIKGSLRTNLVQRLKYILDDMFPVDDRVLLIIKCLTRIAHHSDEAVVTIINTPLLLEKLFAICNLPSESGKRHTAKLLILFRVIACRSQECAEILCTRFHLISYLLSSIRDSVTKTMTASQCTYLWLILLHRKIAIESVSEFSGVLFDLLHQLASRSSDCLKDGDIVLANAFITLFIFLFESFPQTVLHFRPILERLGCQWLNSFVNGTKNARNLIKLISNSVYLLTCVIPAENHDLVKSLFKILKFNRLIQLSGQLRNGSYLLNAVKTNYVESLPSLCIPTSILVADSNFLLLHAVIKCLLRNDCFDGKEDHVALIDNIWQTYVMPSLNRANLSEITAFWPARFEVQFLYDLLFLNARLPNLSVQQERQLLRLAFALLRIVQTDDSSLIEPIFDKILFDEHLHDRVISSSFKNTEGFVDIISRETHTQYLDIVKRIFANLFKVPSAKMILTSTKRGTECAMPTDWFYVPILKISNAYQEKNRNNQVTCKDASTCKMMDCILRWIRFVECLADDINTDMSLSTRFCRICCVFFCSDAFLELRNLLSDILRLLLKHNDELEFNTPIPGLSSFYDFYRELCEQFAGCSYGDSVFGAYLLVPLQQKHDVRFRLYFWSEQTIMLRFFTITSEQLPVPLKFYLQPNERNVELIETYLNIIARGLVKENINSALYFIGVHHIAVFLQSYEEESIAKRLRQKVDRIGNESLKNRILSYEPV